MQSPYRTLKLAPNGAYMSGEDVEAFQTALNGHLEHLALARVGGCAAVASKPDS